MASLSSMQDNLAKSDESARDDIVLDQQFSPFFSFRLRDRYSSDLQNMTPTYILKQNNFNSTTIDQDSAIELLNPLLRSPSEDCQYTGQQVTGRPAESYCKLALFHRVSALSGRIPRKGER